MIFIFHASSTLGVGGLLKGESILKKPSKRTVWCSLSPMLGKRSTKRELVGGLREEIWIELTTFILEFAAQEADIGSVEGGKCD